MHGGRCTYWAKGLAMRAAADIAPGGVQIFIVILDELQNWVSMASSTSVTSVMAAPVPFLYHTCTLLWDLDCSFTSWGSW